MNKVLLGLNILLVAAVAFLFVKLYSNDNTEKSPKTTQVKNSQNLPVTSKIAFIKSDSINNNYLFIKEKSDGLVKEEQRIQTILEAKIKALEKRFGELQQKAASMTPSETEAAQIEMQKGQQEIEALRFNLSNGLVKKREDLQKEFFEKVNSFLKEYNKSQNFDYILSYAEGGGVLLAKDTLDITSDVINGLNEAYKTSKAK